MKKVGSTKKIKSGTLLRVYLKGYGYSHMTCFNSNETFFSAKSDIDLIHFANVGDTLEAYLWLEESRSYEFPLVLIGKIAKYNLLFFDHSDNVIESNDRKCLKAEVDLPVKFFVLGVDEKVKSFSFSDIEFNRGVFTELSDRAAILDTDLQLEMDSLIMGKIHVEGEEVELTAKVLSRCHGSDSLYNIEFTGLPQKSQLMILDYVYDIYREDTP
jgi:hypothetical protein